MHCSSVRAQAGGSGAGDRWASRARVRSTQAAREATKRSISARAAQRGALTARLPSGRTRRLRFFTFLRVSS